MRIQRTPYEVMGLPRDANAEQVKAKYHELARQFHPDRAKDKALAERLFVQINLAYRTLLDPDKRAVLDATLFQADAATVRQSAVAAAPQPSAAPPRQAAPAAQPRPQVNVADLLVKANAAYMGGDRITTHKLCIEALRYDPNNAEAHALLGDVYADQGRRPDALTEYRTAQRAGDSRASLQAKIKRMEAFVVGAQAAAQANGGGGQPVSPTQRPSTPPPSAPSGNGAPRPQAPAQQDTKRGGFLDRFKKN